MMDMMAGMGVLGLLALLLLGVIVGGAVYVGVRAARGSDQGGDTALEALKGRFARGEITSDEFYERESVLRDARPVGRGRR